MIQENPFLLVFICSFTLIGMLFVFFMTIKVLLTIINKIAKIKMSSKTTKWLFIIVIITWAFCISIKGSLLLIIGYLNAMAYYEAKKREGSK